MGGGCVHIQDVPLRDDGRVDRRQTSQGMHDPKEACALGPGSKLNTAGLLVLYQTQ